MLDTTQPVPGRAPSACLTVSRHGRGARRRAALRARGRRRARDARRAARRGAALYDEPTAVFPMMEQPRTQVLRVNLYWGGKHRRRQDAARAGDRPCRPGVRLDALRPHRQLRGPAQDQGALLDLRHAGAGRTAARPERRAARDSPTCSNFAYAAAKRYSGLYPAADGRALPAVQLWMAWNEPNLPFRLKPQYRGSAGAG